MKNINAKKKSEERYDGKVQGQLKCFLNNFLSSIQEKARNNEIDFKFVGYRL